MSLLAIRDIARVRPKWDSLLHTYGMIVNIKKIRLPNTGTDGSNWIPYIADGLWDDIVTL